MQLAKVRLPRIIWTVKNEKKKCHDESGYDNDITRLGGRQNMIVQDPPDRLPQYTLYVWYSFQLSKSFRAPSFLILFATCLSYIKLLWAYCAKEDRAHSVVET
ncbi:hypothetical protein J6590_068499 [Homalodisca vitripennis]|nr:hypothetical protein J6590_068499 [Homalodisca vitripennis]